MHRVVYFIYVEGFDRNHFLKKVFCFIDPGELRLLLILVYRITKFEVREYGRSGACCLVLILDWLGGF